MKYNELNVTAKKPTHRMGRGIAAGQGKTAGRGTKGQKSRTGKGRRPGFEGGQNPFMQRVPKLRGFKTIKTSFETISTDSLSQIKGKVDNFSLFEAKLVSSPYAKAKLVLGKQPVVKQNISLQAASGAANAAVEKAGGSFTAVEQIARPAKKTVQK